MNFTAITIPNLRYPPIDSYTIPSMESNREYELRMATYTNRGLSAMSNSIQISVPTHARPRINQMGYLPSLDEILDNITKLQNPSRMKSNLAPTPTQKSSDILYLIIGIIAGILLILMIILIAMCILRLLQRKKFLSHVKSSTGSEYYSDGLHKTFNPDYAASPCLQHGVVSVDGKLIPFAYPPSTKSPQIYCRGLAHHTTVNENGTIRLNTNPMAHLDNENMQENFYHTLTPFSLHSQYEECPIHHHLVNYSSDTLPFLNNNKIIDPHVHHPTCQRQYKTKGIITSSINKGLLIFL